MMLDPDEVVGLSRRALDYGDDFRQALDAAGPGGKSITRQERKHLIVKGLKLVMTLVIEALD